MSNAASVIVTLGAILLGLLVMSQVNLSAASSSHMMAVVYLFAVPLAAVVFIGSLIGYAVGHRRGKDEAYASIVGALVAGAFSPLIGWVAVSLLKSFRVI